MKKLSIIIAVLIVVLIGININSKHNERSFKKYVIQVDTANVTQIIIKPQNKKEIIINKKNNLWRMAIDNKEVATDKASIMDMLSQIVKLKTKSIVATSNEKWDKYEVSDSTGINVIIKSNKKELADFIIGKFSYKQLKSQNPYQPNMQMLSYVRTRDDNNVYSVDGYLNVTFNKKEDAFRKKSLITGDKNTWSKINFNYGADNSFSIVKQNEKWTMNGTLIDSTIIVSYLSKIENLSSNKFNDNANIENNKPVSYVKIKRDSLPPIIINSYKTDTDSIVYSSSINDGNVFMDNNIKTQLFVNKNYFKKN
jgi:hypothetical protein